MHDILIKNGFELVCDKTYKRDDCLGGVMARVDDIIYCSLCPVDVFDQWANSRYIVFAVDENSEESLTKALKLCYVIDTNWFLEGLRIEL